MGWVIYSCFDNMVIIRVCYVWCILIWVVLWYGLYFIVLCGYIFVVYWRLNVFDCLMRVNFDENNMLILIMICWCIYLLFVDDCRFFFILEFIFIIFFKFGVVLILVKLGIWSVEDIDLLLLLWGWVIVIGF